MATAKRTIPHTQSWQTEPRDGLNVEIVDASDESNLLVQHHLGEKHIYSLFDLGTGNLSSLRAGPRSYAEQ